MIIHGDFDLGQAIVVKNELSTFPMVSKTPIREAFYLAEL